MHGEHTMKYQNSKEGELVRTSICLNKQVIEKIDEHAALLGINRSAAISVLVQQAFAYQEQIKTVNEFNKNFGGYLEELKSIAGGINKGVTRK